MKKIFLSVSMLAAVAALVVGATSAFFSDTETSTNNTFAAGDIDLKIDNTSYYNGVASPNTSWGLKDLTVEKFFDFRDVKPGDYGEDTISLHVGSNDAWVCADVTLRSDDDVTCTEPETTDDPTCGIPVPEPNGDLTDGELADLIEFIWWVDDGDNVLEDDERVLPGGPLGAIPVGSTANQTLADGQESIFGVPGTPVPGDSTNYIGKAWCFGNIAANPDDQDGFGNVKTPAGDNNGNSVLGEPGDGGFDCTGASVISNASQSDMMTADVSFRAIQSRNNPSFDCQPQIGP